MQPAGVFEWRFNGGALLADTIQIGNKLTIVSLSAEDFGPYTCVATNNIDGRDHRASFTIRVIEAGKGIDFP